MREELALHEQHKLHSAFLGLSQVHKSLRMGKTCVQTWKWHLAREMAGGMGSGGEGGQTEQTGWIRDRQMEKMEKRPGEMVSGREAQKHEDTT